MRLGNWEEKTENTSNPTNPINSNLPGLNDMNIPFGIGYLYFFRIKGIFNAVRNHRDSVHALPGVIDPYP